MTPKTEYEFSLPKGYMDDEGTLQKQGVMRLATIGDEMQAMKDRRVRDNPAYLSVILLSRVVTKLGALEEINTRVIENLFSADFVYLQNLYDQINKHTPVVDAACPKCQHTFAVELPDRAKPA